ncbi:MAG: nucleotidyltransferase family protein [Phycisphaerales bacterium]
MIVAIVLAAGESRRMGVPKPLLRFGDTTFLEQIVSVLRRSDVDGITVVLGSRAEAVRASTDLSALNVVVNEGYRDGQLSSLIVGLRSVPKETDAILVCLVDSPFITTDVVGRIVGAFHDSSKPIVGPVFSGRRGHPALFGDAVFEELLNAPAGEGARHVVNADRARVLEVEVSEPNILARIDTPEDYASYFGMPPQIREGT